MSRTDGFVCLTVGDEQYAVRDSRVLLIARAEQMSAEPADHGRIGTIAIDRLTAPVFSMRRVLAVRSAASGRHIVVTHGARGPIGWMVDRIQRSSLQTVSALLPVPSLAGPRAAEWFEGVVVVDDRAMLVLSTPGGPAGDAPRKKNARRAIAPSAGAPAGSRSPFVVTFTTPALPPSAVDRYALSARQVVSVTSVLNGARVPGSPPHVAGVAVGNGEIVTIVDFRNGDERPAAPERAMRLIVARTGSRLLSEAIAFPVGAPVALHRPTSDERAQRAMNRQPPFVRGLFDVAGERIGLLDLDVLAGGVYGAAA